MAAAASTSSGASKRTKWMRKSNSNSSSKTKSTNWVNYSDVENSIIEAAFTAKEGQVSLDDCYIDLKRCLEISNNDHNKRRPIKRVEYNRDEVRLREERFVFNPIGQKRPFHGEYGWIPPFIIEVKKCLELEEKELISCDQPIIAMLVEKAALGIIEEGKKAGKKCEAEWMAKQLMETKNNGIEEVWKCCANLYSKQSFLYEGMNETMRLVENEQYEETWRGKLYTFGPFFLLLWKNPFNGKLNENMETLYRGINLSSTEIDSFRNDCFQETKSQRSFQAFTSCSRNRAIAEKIGNTLLIMIVKCVFAMSLVPFSDYPYEEEVLLFPGVCFTFERVEFDKAQNKHLIYLNLNYRSTSK
jgi:hypothetical protein